MSESTSKRTSVVAFLAILLMSAATMIWLLWRFPLLTVLITLGVIALLGVSAHWARAIEVIDTDIEHGEPSR